MYSRNMRLSYTAKVLGTSANTRVGTATRGVTNAMTDAAIAGEGLNAGSHGVAEHLLQFNPVGQPGFGRGESR